MFENQWEIPHAITRPIEIDPSAPVLATQWAIAVQAASSIQQGKEITADEIWGEVQSSEEASPAEENSASPERGEAYRNFLAKVNEITRPNFVRSHSSLLIYVPTLKPRASEIDESIAALLKEDKASVASWRTLDGSKWEGGPVLAIWPDEKHLATIADDRRTTALCVIPSSEHDISAWSYGTRPELLATTENSLWGEHGPEVLDPVVREALSSLTVVTNVSSRLVPDADRANAIQAFRLLWDGGHDLVPVEVHAWALANGWPPNGAYALREIAERIAEGRTFATAKVDPSPFDLDSLRTWRELARARFIPRPSKCKCGHICE